MTTVGIRKLKNHLSAYLRQVRRGDTVLITDRGRVVAELRRPGLATRGDTQAGLERLLLEGKALRAQTNDPSLYPPAEPLLRAGESLSLLDDERGEH